MTLRSLLTLQIAFLLAGTSDSELRAVLGVVMEAYRAHVGSEKKQTPPHARRPPKAFLLLAVGAGAGAAAAALIMREKHEHKEMESPDRP